MPEHDPERAAPAWLTAGGTDDEVLGLLKTGKEAEVFLVERHTLDGSLAATLARASGALQVTDAAGEEPAANE